MKAIGTRAEAMQAARLVNSWDRIEIQRDWWRNNCSIEFANGWKLVGVGSTRFALLSPSKIIYKVNIHLNVADHNNANKCEWEKYRVFKTLPRQRRAWSLAKTSVFWINSEPVIAMEYLGDRESEPRWGDIESVRHEIRNLLNVMDLADFNARSVDGTIVLIDFAW